MPLNIAPNLVPVPGPAVVSSAFPAPAAAPGPLNPPLSKALVPPSLSNPRVESATQAKAIARSSIDPAWKDLAPVQQQALGPLQPEWDKLDSRHKAKWIEISKKFVSMKPDEQARIQARMRAWVTLTPDQRRVARESYVRTKKLNTDQKSAQWEQYKNLPEEQKRKLAAEAAKNKVASPPPAQSKSKIVPPIKSTPAPVLQRSVTPSAARSAAQPTTVPLQPPATANPVTQPSLSPVQGK